MDEAMRAVLDPSNWTDEWELHTYLRLDGMYFRSAQASLEKARASRAGIKKARAAYRIQLARLEAIQTKYDGDVERAYDELEPVAISMEDFEYRVGLAYAPYLEGLALTHILSAAALEAHINIWAAARLSKRALKKFDRQPLAAKWLDLPALLSLRGFSARRKPFVHFIALLRYRNALVHYRDRAEIWTSPGVPGFLRDLGLTVAAAQRSLRTVREMVEALSAQLKEETPFWLLRAIPFNYLEIDVPVLRRKR